MKHVIGLSLLLLCAACSAPKGAGQTALLLAAHTNKVIGEAERFAKSRDKIDKARQANINYLEQNALDLEQDNILDVRVWAIANDTERINLYEGILAATEEASKQSDAMEDLRREHAKLLASTRNAVKLRSAKLADTAKALSQLGEEADFKATVKFYVAYFQEVRKTYQELEEDLNTQAALGAKQAKKNLAASESASDTLATTVEAKEDSQ